MTRCRQALVGTLAILLLASQPLHSQQVGVDGLSARELLAFGEKAFNEANWDAATDAFLKFIADFGGLPETAQAVNRVKPLLAICHVRTGRMDEAMPLIEECLAMDDLAPAQRTDLVFFGGLGALQTGDPAKARTYLGAAFNDARMERSRRMEALILGGLSYVIEQDWEGAIKFFETYGGEINTYSPEAGARANILKLHALMQLERWQDAASLAQSLHQSLDEIRQVVSYASMLVRIGDQFLQDGEHHASIRILRMIPPMEEIVRLQNTRLAEAKQDLASAERGSNTVRAAQLRTSITEMERELEAFATIPDFDSAARLRLAGAYFQLNRIREAALILDQMVRQMKPDPIVESATASLLRAWLSLDRHKRAVRTAELYMERCKDLPEKPNLPEVMFLKGQALEGLFEHAAAAEAYLDTAASFPKDPIAARAEFMAAYNILQLEDYERAGDMFDRQLKKLRKNDEMFVHVSFWRAMAYYFNQQWEPARKILGDYLADAAAGSLSAEYADDATFRVAYTLFAEARYPEAIGMFQKFEAEFPSSEWLAEVLLTLGDALGGEGALAEADRAYARIGVEAPGFHDEGWMKRGNILKVTGDLDGMRRHFNEFLEKRAKSPRVAEALQWLGWIAKQEGNTNEARRIYWDAIERFGNDAVRPGLEEIFLALHAFYSADERSELENRLKMLLITAEDQRKKRFATRLGWAIAQLHLTAKGEHAGTPEERAEKSSKQLAALVPQINPKQTSPRILADVADAVAQQGDIETAQSLYEGLRQWWPRAPERDRAFAGLGFIAAKAGDLDEALTYFTRFERTSIMPKGAPDDNGIALVQGELGAKVAMAQADVLSARDPEKAIHILRAIQKDRGMPTRFRAEALMQTAKLYAKRGQYRESLPYYEQIYILFNRFPDLVAAAYYGRGQALERLAMADKAREVYSELSHRPDLAGLEPAKLATARAIALGGILPPNDPEDSVIPPASGP